MLREDGMSLDLDRGLQLGRGGRKRSTGLGPEGLCAKNLNIITHTKLVLSTNDLAQ